VLDAMRKMEPGMHEYEVQAVVEFHYIKNEAEWAYPSIIASGSNATTLHYDRNTRKIAHGDLVLMDVGAEYDYYASDITRTVPISGRFSPAQADIYQVVYNAQEEAMKALRPGKTIQQVHERATEAIKAGLVKLGLITDPNTDQYRHFFMHGTSHWVGLDVHDVGVRSAPFQPGMILTVEPGIYVREDLLDTLVRDGKNGEWVEKIRPAFEKYRGIGVRIEDDFLITPDGYDHLSHKIPRQIRDVEKWIQTNRSRSARTQ
jgi:Xaa-Pro aminopeptidase